MVFGDPLVDMHYFQAISGDYHRHYSGLQPCLCTSGDDSNLQCSDGALIIGAGDAEPDVCTKGAKQVQKPWLV